VFDFKKAPTVIDKCKWIEDTSFEEGDVVWQAHTVQFVLYCIINI
jgi:hypothetical protein